MRRVELQWARGRLFDMEAARVFQQRVTGSATVTSCTSKDSRTASPHGAHALTRSVLLKGLKRSMSAQW